MLKTRVFTALVAAPIFLCVLLIAGETVRFAALTVIVGLLAYEWASLLQPQTGIGQLPTPAHNLKAFVFALLVCLSFGLYVYVAFLWQVGLLLWGLAAVFWAVLMPVLLQFFAKHGAIPLPIVLRYVCAYLAILGFGFGFFKVLLLDKWAVLVVLLSIWASDVGAYFAGRAWGRGAFAPSISPNKTWAGYVGGLLAAMAVLIGSGYLGNLAQLLRLNMVTTVGFLLILLALAPFGDLWQSALKRQANVKDSGACLPGHGGMFDRMDSWLPVFTLFGFVVSMTS